MDPDGKMLFTKLDASPGHVGEALVEALSASRVLRPDELDAFFDPNSIAQRYEKWVADLIQRFGYSSRRTLFKRMKRCSVDQSSGVITLRPLRHEKLEGWSGDGIAKSDYVQLGEDSSPVEIGQGVLLALSRCVA